MSTHRNELPESWLDLWDRSAVPTWGIGPDGTIRFLNSRAEGLLGMTSSEAVGKPCHEVIKGLGENLEPFCSKHCPVSAAASHRDEVAAETLLVGECGSRRWTRVLPIVMDAPDGSEPILVESAVDIDRWKRIEGYIVKLTMRDPLVGERRLTQRENEILGLLADGFAQADIANRLGLGYTTLRTHVQRILAKLGVHSIHAAVAHRLLASSVEE